MKGIGELSKLFEDKFGTGPTEIVKMPGAGSARQYYRLLSREGTEWEQSNVRQDISCIGVDGTDAVENRCFITLAESFRKAAINVPEIYCASSDWRYYLQEDLGDRSLFSLLPKDGTVPEGEARRLIESSLRYLVVFHKLPEKDWGPGIMNPPFSGRQVMWDLNYFKYEFLRSAAIPFDENRMENEFEKLRDRIMESVSHFSGFMYRDFQSRNIMIRKGEPYFIDFQGGRRGPGIYDVVSLLWQAKAFLPESFRREMLDVYCREYTSSRAEREALKKSYALFALLRTLQVLGAYGLRGLIEKKSHFIESIPRGLANLNELKEAGILDDYPELASVATILKDDERFLTICERNNGRLKIKVFSFSYKKGYPVDYTGNGGGFMFDCRGMHNPGRYEEYRHLTGLDAPVKEFLEKRGEVQGFTENAVSLVKPTIARYLSRGFTSLQIGFGCTGGQHRSVYCAETMARKLRELFPEAEIEICHREQQISIEI